MLRAAWLGHWKAPWGLERGRRWGDAAWALAAISQAWLLGGRHGAWPRLEAMARPGHGPWVPNLPTALGPRPDPAWVAKLRHGSEGIAADRRGGKEPEWLAWAWEALLEGDGTPWMAVGSLVLDLPQRLRWFPLLAAVDPEGSLQVPPFLDWLPLDFHTLPSGWWECLLRAQDAEGRLLPEGPLDPELPWPAIQRHAEALCLSALPEDLTPFATSPWLHRTAGGHWFLNPSLRAWARGWGASPAGLGPLVSGNLGSGAPPDAALADLLQLRMPGLHPQGWQPSLEADLGEHLQRPAPPPAASHPTWDRLRMRWGGEPAPAAPTYPAWGTPAHPCADPFHWMAEGRAAVLAYAPERALRAFTLAHGHFLRLGAIAWAARAASNAASTGPPMGRPAGPWPLGPNSGALAATLEGPGAG